MIDWDKKKVLVTGSEGLIGKELVEQLSSKGAIVTNGDVKLGCDLRYYDQCIKLTAGQDYVFHCMGVKGSPKKTNEKPADFFVPMVQCNTNILEASRQAEVQGLVYTSSIAVLNPETDKYPAWAKMTGEMQIAAYKIQYPDFGSRCAIVRPANIYGRYDDFRNEEAMVVTSLARKSVNEDTLQVWGDGSEVRDFVNSKDVARAMIIIMEQMPKEPVNIGSGKGVKISSIAKQLGKLSGKEVVFNPKQSLGDKRRVMNIEGLKKLGFKPEVSMEDGLKEVYAYAKGAYK